MVNQAALKAAIDEAPSVTMEHFDFARDKVIMGKWVSVETCLLHCMHVCKSVEYSGEKMMMLSV